MNDARVTIVGDKPDGQTYLSGTLMRFHPETNHSEPPECPTCGAIFLLSEKHCHSDACTWWLCTVDSTLYDEATEHSIRVRPK